MLPSREEAEALLRDAERCNPGPWGNHSRVAAHCAEAIARACGDMDAGKAYVLGLLHDIGRKFGVSHMRHVSDGYSYMMSLGYDEAARICLTHSFAGRTIDGYVGRLDVNEQELAMIKAELSRAAMDEYDDLIQLCDALAGSEGIMDIEARMDDVRRRYGSYPREKWDMNMALKARFEAAMGRDVYEVVDKERYRPQQAHEQE